MKMQSRPIQGMTADLDHRQFEGRGHMHRAGIIPYVHPTAPKKCYRLAQCKFTHQVDKVLSPRFLESQPERLFVGSPKDQELNAVIAANLGADFHVIIDRPHFSVFSGARTASDEHLIVMDAEALQMRLSQFPIFIPDPQLHFAA